MFGTFPLDPVYTRRVPPRDSHLSWADSEGDHLPLRIDVLFPNWSSFSVFILIEIDFREIKWGSRVTAPFPTRPAL